MNIILLVPQSGHSFINQAQALAVGFIALGHTARVVRVEAEKRHPGFDPGSLVIAVGSWVHYPELIEGPKNAGFRVVPWLVADDRVDRFIGELNRIPVLLTTSKHGQSIFFRDGVTSKIEIIPEAVDDAFWKPLSVEEIRPFEKFLSIQEAGVEMPRKFDLVKVKTDGFPILFTTGGDATSKGAQEVLHALGRIYESNPTLPWMYLLKTWPAAESFRRSGDELELASQLGIGDRIRYVVGEYSREFLRGLTNMSDICVAPSRSEGFGLPLVEAQMCGKPAVGLAANASGETIIDGETGFVIGADCASDQPRADITHLTEILSHLISDSSLRKKLGQAARVHAQNTYNPKKIAQQFLNFLPTLNSKF